MKQTSSQSTKRALAVYLTDVVSLPAVDQDLEICRRRNRRRNIGRKRTRGVIGGWSLRSKRTLAFNIRNMRPLVTTITLTFPDDVRPRRWDHETAKIWRNLGRELKELGCSGYLVKAFGKEAEGFHIHGALDRFVKPSTLRSLWRSVLGLPEDVALVIHVGMFIDTPKRRGQQANYYINQDKDRPESFGPVRRWWSKFGPADLVRPIGTIEGTEKEVAPYIRPCKGVLRARNKKMGFGRTQIKSYQRTVLVGIGGDLARLRQSHMLLARFGAHSFIESLRKRSSRLQKGRLSVREFLAAFYGGLPRGKGA